MGAQLTQNNNIIIVGVLAMTTEAIVGCKFTQIEAHRLCPCRWCCYYYYYYSNEMPDLC